jgi:SNF2 family DNA or RNA helicase
MKIATWLSEILSKEKPEESIEYLVDEEGIHFKIDADTLSKVIKGEISPLAQAQYLALSMLVEQGLALKNKTEYFVPKDVVTELDHENRLILGLPEQWNGSILADIKGVSSRANFNVILDVADLNGRKTSAYTVTGPIIKFSANSQYVLTPLQLKVFSAKSVHEASQNKEYDNLLFLSTLQKAKELGVDIALSHFEKHNISQPGSVSISIEHTPEGDLLLTPNFGTHTDPETIRKVLGQLDSDTTASLRVGHEIVLIDETVKEAAKQLAGTKIKKADVEAFILNPKAFLPAEGIEAEAGFTVKITGATQFTHAYFGETEESGIDWFGSSNKQPKILAISKLEDKINNETDLAELVQQIEDGKKAGAEEIVFEGDLIDISNEEKVKETLEVIRKNIKNKSSLDEPETDDEVSDTPDFDSSDNETEKPEKIVVDIDLVDEGELKEESTSITKTIENSLCDEKLLDWSTYHFKPYNYQITGVRWIIGLYLSQQADRKAKNRVIEQSGGALLADDMGLGKTFMALAAIQHLYKQAKDNNTPQKPVLIVAPLSLIQTWYDEVGKAFKVNPFKDMIRLQSDADLPVYRVAGRETYGVLDDDGVANISYSLKIGDQYGTDRLDVDGRLVITTYQTLSDYQFSLREIDWGMVVFDEAQNIKNPNTFQSRAARGLRADFKLVATGTPVENSLRDFWAMMETANTGCLDTYQHFRETYITPIARAAGDEVEHIRASVGRQLRETVGALMLRRVKEDNLDGLPTKSIYVGVDSADWIYKAELGPEMEGSQKDAYESIINSMGNNEEEFAIAALQKLRAVSLHPRLINGGSFKPSYKLKELDAVFSESSKLMSVINTLNEVQQRNEKCIIFCVNKSLQKFLSLALGSYYRLGLLSVINGDAKAVSKNPDTATRKSMIADFEAEPGFNLIIMSPVAAGVGLTVVGANNVIHYERHWTPAKEAQATDRVYRIGQTKPVHIYVPILRHPELESFDENLHKLLATKTQLRDAVVAVESVKPSPSGIHSKLTLPDHILQPEDIINIGWQEFEALAAELFGKLLNATSCELTATNDHGADAVVFNQQEAYLIQCKHTQSGKYDSAEAVHEVKNAEPYYKQAYKRDFTKLVFITNAKTLSPRVREAAKLHKVVIYAYKEMSELLKKYPISREMLEKRLAKPVAKV